MDKEIIEGVCIIAVILTACIAIWAFAGVTHKRMGFVVCLIGQVFWTWLAFSTGHLYMLMASVWVVLNCIRGLVNHIADADMDRVISFPKNNVDYRHIDGYCFNCNSYHPSSQPCMPVRR